MYITLYLHRDSTGIRENLNAMKHSFELNKYIVMMTKLKRGSVNG